MTTPDADFVGAIDDVAFESGGHMLRWADAMTQTLRVYEMLLLCARSDLSAALSHRRWRVLSGELPPRLRAKRVTVHILYAAAAARAAITALGGFRRAVENGYIKPAQRAAWEAADPDGDE